MATKLGESPSLRDIEIEGAALANDLGKFGTWTLRKPVAVAACFRIHELGCKGIVSTNSVPGFLRNTCRSPFNCREKEFTRRMP